MKTKTLLLALLVSLLAGCAAGPPIDYSYTASSQDSRAQYLILHFTWGDYESSLKDLTQGPVSSHYLVRDNPVEIYGLVDESRRAYHAGDSSWKGQTMLNAASIGIEIVNAGNRLAPQGVAWQEYPKAQVDAVVKLVKWIVARHQIRPDHILGHSDIAPQRKLDPGPLFPWKRLADEGLIPWPDARRVAERLPVYRKDLPGIAWFQEKLAQHGFEVPRNGEYDEATVRVIAAFQMKYRPAKFDGVPDAETAALLDVITSPPDRAP
jgi:N-acetylmuramoyl-L-alanine amidase